MTDVHAFHVGGIGKRKTGETVGKEAEGGAVHGIAGALEDDGQRAGSERVDVVCVADANGFVVAFDLNLASGEDFAVLIAEDGDEDFVLKPDFRGVPVNV